MRWRPLHLLRFRLRSLMLAVLIAALAMRLWLRPGPEHRVLGGMTIQCDRFVSPRNRGEVTIPDGAYCIRDRHGRLMCAGTMKSGAPIGRWTFYHPNGRRSLAGSCRDGQRVGTWTAWDEQGRKRATFRFAVPGHDAFPPAFVMNHLNGTTIHGELRQGRTTAWWDNGRLASDGDYRSNVRHGPWTLGERDGTTRGVTYADGLEVIADQRTARIAPGLQSAESTATADDEFVYAVEAATRSVDGVTVLGEALGQATAKSDPIRTRFLVQTLARCGSTARAALPVLEQFGRRSPPAVQFDVRLAQVAVESPRSSAIFAALVDDVLAAPPDEQDELLSRMARAGAGLVTHLERMLDDADDDRMLLALVVLGRMTQAPDTVVAADAALERAMIHARPAVARLAPGMRKSFRRPSGCISLIPVVASSHAPPKDEGRNR